MAKKTQPEAPGGPQTRSVQQIEQIPVSDLIPYARNARTHSEQQVAQIAGSIQEFGFCNPVLIDATNGIIAGHGRVLAAGRLKLETVPCIRLTHLSDAQRRAYILADNRIALNSGWDTEMLANELSDLHADDIDLGLMGFDADELAKLLQFETGEPPEPEVPESNYSEQFGVIVVCETEAAQESTFNALQSQGFNCKVVTT